MDGITDSLDISLEMVKDSEAYCATVHGVAKSHVTLSLVKLTLSEVNSEESTDREGEELLVVFESHI